MDTWYLPFAVAVGTVLALVTFDYTSEMPIIKDAAENTRAAYHLAHTGVLGGDLVATETPRPLMRREPLPIVATAGFLLLHPAFDNPYTIAELLDGRLTQTVKGVNAFWRFLAAIFVFSLCLELFPDQRLAASIGATCIVVSEFFFFASPGVVDRLYTELPAVAMMLLAAWSAVRFVRNKTTLSAMGFGIALGALALTKVAFLYIEIGFILLLLAVEGLRRPRTDEREPSWLVLLSTYAIIALAMLGTVTPWMFRNFAKFGTPQIVAGTEGPVVGIRMLLTEQPLLGAIYFFSPSSMKTKVIGPLTGYTKADLLPGGRLEQLVSEKDKKWEIVSARMLAEGYFGPRDAWLKQAALEAALQNPLRYIASIGVFAYKGMWFMDRAGALLNLAALLCFFGVFFGAIFFRNQVLIAAFGLPAGLFFFISTFTHALRRYNEPMTPFVILSVLWLLVQLTRWAYNLPLRSAQRNTRTRG